MTEIVIATRDATLRDPITGEGWRIVRGRTLADARHPCVTEYPNNWDKVTVDLGVESDDVSRETAAEADAEATQLAGELHDARTEADSYRDTLAAIADELKARGLVERFGVQPDHEGWLVELVRLALDNPGEPEPETAAADVEPVAAPVRPARKARAKAAPVVDDAE